MFNYNAGQEQLSDYKIHTRLISPLALLDCMDSMNNDLLVAHTPKQVKGILKSNIFLIQLKSQNFCQHCAAWYCLDAK